MPVFAKIVSRLPPGLIRGVGRLQFTLPIVGPLIGAAGRKLIASEGVIKYGIGAGLRFDATGGFAGYLLGTSEPLEQAALARHLKPGAVFYDVGANGSVRAGAGDVRLVTIDDCSLQPPDVVMIDVEGAEIEVLRGMMCTVREHRPVIMCEVHWIVDEFDRIRREIEGHGYRAETLNGQPFPTTPKHYHVVMIPHGNSTARQREVVPS